MINQSINQRKFIVSPTSISPDCYYITYEVHSFNFETLSNELVFIGKGYPTTEFGVEKFEVDVKDFYESLRNKNTFRLEPHFTVLTDTELQIKFQQYDTNNTLISGYTEWKYIDIEKEKMSIKSITTYNGYSNHKISLKDFDIPYLDYFAVYPILRLSVTVPDAFKPNPNLDYYEFVFDTFLPVSIIPDDFTEDGFKNVNVIDMSLQAGAFRFWTTSNYQDFFDNFVKQKTIGYRVNNIKENLNVRSKVKAHYKDGTVDDRWFNLEFEFINSDGQLLKPLYDYNGTIGINTTFDLVTDINNDLNTYLNTLAEYIRRDFKKEYFPNIPTTAMIMIKPLGFAYTYLVAGTTLDTTINPMKRYVEWQDLDVTKTPYPTLTFINSDVIDNTGNDVTVKLCEELGCLKGFTTNNYNQTTFKDKYDDTYVVSLDNKKTITCYVDPDWFSVTTNQNKLNYVLLKDAMYSSRLSYLQTAMKNNNPNNKKAEVNGVTNPDNLDFAFLYGRIKSVEDVKIPSKYNSNGEKMPSLKIEFEIYE